MRKERKAEKNREKGSKEKQRKNREKESDRKEAGRKTNMSTYIIDRISGTNELVPWLVDIVWFW